MAIAAIWKISTEKKPATKPMPRRMETAAPVEGCLSSWDMAGPSLSGRAAHVGTGCAEGQRRHTLPAAILHARPGQPPDRTKFAKRRAKSNRTTPEESDR